MMDSIEKKDGDEGTRSFKRKKPNMQVSWGKLFWMISHRLKAAKKLT